MVCYCQASPTKQTSRRDQDCGSVNEHFQSFVASVRTCLKCAACITFRLNMYLQKNNKVNKVENEIYCLCTGFEREYCVFHGVTTRSVLSVELH